MPSHSEYKAYMTELAETSIAWYQADKAVLVETKEALKEKRLYECQVLEKKMQRMRVLYPKYHSKQQQQYQPRGNR